MTITEDAMTKAGATFVTNKCKAEQHGTCPGAKGPWTCTCSCHTTTKTGASAEGASDEVKPENAAADMSGELHEQNDRADDAPEPTPHVEGQGDEGVAAAAVLDGPGPTSPDGGDRVAKQAGSGRKSVSGRSADSPPSEASVGDFAPPTPAMRFEQVPLDHIVPSIDNPRRDLGDLESLVASIKAVGIIEPLIVEWCEEPADGDHWVDDGEPHFHLIAGHRREKAARDAGLTEVPCLIRQPVADDARLELMLIENLQRADLVPLDEANGYRRLVELGMSQRTIAERVGCSQSHVSKRISLLELPAEARDPLDAGGITLEDAAELLKLKDHPDVMKRVLKETKGDRDPEQIEYAIGAAQREVEIANEMAKARTDAEALGWMVVEAKPYGEKVDWRRISRDQYDSQGLHIDVKKHRKEPCHGVELRSGYQGVSAADVCMEPERHSSKGASELKVPVAAKRKLTASELKERERQAARREASTTRKLVLQATLRGRLPKSAIDTVLTAFIEDVGLDPSKLAIELLDVEPHMRKGWNGKLEPDTKETLRREARRPGGLAKVALAVAMALGEQQARSRYYGHAHELYVGHYRLLESVGYERSKSEEDEIAKAIKEVEARAAKTAAAATKAAAPKVSTAAKKARVAKKRAPNKRAPAQ